MPSIQGDCRVDRDKVLIECALGAVGGVLFPRRPDDDPVGEGRLTWRMVELAGTDPRSGRCGWLAIRCGARRDRFDLSLPLRDQIDWRALCSWCSGSVGDQVTSALIHRRAA